MHRRSSVEQPAPLLEYLFTHWPDVKRTQVRHWLKFQSVLVNDRVVTQFDHVLAAGDVVAIRTDRYAAPKTVLRFGMKVHFEDAELIVIDKPSGLLSIASDSEKEKTAYFQLTDYVRGGNGRSRERVWIVHRLDRDTSGLMVFAKTLETKEALQGHWDRFEKYYEAVVEGRMPEKEGTFASDLDESHRHRVFSAPQGENTRHAITHYRVLGMGRTRSLVGLRLETGRRHQIRVHLSEAGFPIVGDLKYEAKTNPLRRLALHSSELGLQHPRTGRWLRFRSPMPRDLARLIR
jgi:23S rRNA pseudouridine1911/1915/1917 synthase